VLIEYALLHDAIAIFYITPQRSGVVRVPTTAAVVQGLVERSADLLRQRSDTAAVRATTGALYRLLISPIERELTGADRLILIPDRQLHALPFAALFDNSRQRYLVDDFALSIAPSAASVIRHSSRSASGTVLVVGDPRDENATPLPGATREAETVAAIYNSSTLLSGEQATRARFIAAARQSTIIHYAGHAEDASADPFSVLHLAAVRGDASGDLDATAIAALDLSHAPLVVLAACGTMRGDSEHVEGMPSIARAFLAAGASGVVGTLWEIDDDTAAPLFHRMHVALHNGASPAAALRTAQLALAHDPDTRLSNPASWAAVELLGCANEQAATGRRRSE
jgi:CHAT domain-containing protein